MSMGSLHAPPQHSIRLYLLGSFRLERSGYLLSLPTRKAEALLAYLVLYPGVHAREKVAALFWGDSSDEHSRRSLRTALSVLRKRLGDDLLLADREAVQLNPAFAIWVDALEFQQQAARLLAANDADIAAIDLDLYRGDLLTDFYEDWIAPQREAYRTLWIDTLLRLIQRLRTRGEYAQAITMARRVLGVDPANERAHQHLMFCFATLGDRAAALRQYDECVLQLENELGVEPSQATTALYQRIKQTRVHPQMLEAANTNLPIPLTSFIGRLHEMVAVKQLLNTARLLTLTGVGGCGKTRLAIQVATELVEQYTDGVWWVDLAALHEGELVPQIVGKVLGTRQSQAVPPIDSLVGYLRSKHLLLALDNCEHLTTACAYVAEAILNQCPHIQLLVTSREVLGIQGEVAWLVPSLSLPAAAEAPAVEDLLHWEGTQLFVERAKATRHEFTVTPTQAHILVQICRRLDGIPLAVELAAARVKTLTVEQIADRLEDRFNLLTTGSRTALPRQQTLRAMIDWSYALLSPAEQIMLQRLSVFAGGGNLAAAEAVCAGDEIEVPQVLDLLTRLVDKSLLATTYFDTEIQYRMLETIRQYAYEKLSESGEVDYIRDHHLRYFAQLALAAETRWHTADQLTWLRRIEADSDNLRAALEWALQHESPEPARLSAGLQLAVALGPYWNLQAEYTEGQRWLEVVITQIDVQLQAGESTEAVPADPATAKRFLKAKALYELGVLFWFQSHYEVAYPVFKQSATLYQEIGELTGQAYSSIYWGHCEWDRGNSAKAYELWDRCMEHFRKVNDSWGLAWTLAYLGRAARESNHYIEARQYYEQSATLLRELGDRWALSIVLSHLGMVAYQQGDFASAQTLFEQRLAIGREFGFKQHVAYALYLLGLVAWNLGNVTQAEQWFRESLVLNHKMGNLNQIVGCLVGLAWVFSEKGQIQRASHLLSAAQAVEESFAGQSGSGDRFTYKPILAALRAELDATIIEPAAKVPTMVLEEAIQEALAV